MIERFTYNHVVDMESQNQLIQIGASDTANCFKIGDIVNERWEAAIINGWHKPNPPLWDDYVTKDFIEASVSYYVKNKSKRTVRYYSEVAAFYPDHVRAKYDELSFTHFARAKRYEDWEDYLTYAKGEDGIRSADACDIEWQERLKAQLSTDVETPPPDENYDQEDNKFSFSNVCKLAISLLDRFSSDQRVRDVVQRLEEIVEEETESLHEHESI